MPSFNQYQNFSIHEGCYGAASCNGTLAITISELSNVLCGITEINLSKNNLQGSITKEVANFQNLTYLNLQNNQLNTQYFEN